MEDLKFISIKQNGRHIELETFRDYDVRGLVPGCFSDLL